MKLYRLLCFLAAAWLASANPCIADERLDFFEKRIRPLLIEHCYSCHSADSTELQGGLRLDLKAGWQAGGDSGEAAVVPGQPSTSPLVLAIEHADNVSPMPPKQAKLSAGQIADIKTWIATGAFDPRDGAMTSRDKQRDWETEYQRRLDWWSLKPLAKRASFDATIANTSGDASFIAATQVPWARNEVDAFIQAGLNAHGLQPGPEADRATLVRRLSFALTGLPPDPSVCQTFLADASPSAYEHLVEDLLASPHFGERWARHWMDVVHYSDTHGYEWDVPVKNAWRYRDYLVRAFNDDVPYQQMILEQIAGDLLPPRINSELGINEALIGPLMLRLGERRHGDNSAAEGISQEAVANMIDTLGKAFLGTTLACAQCHDHKLDAVEQRDYYSLAGMLMSTRYISRPIDLETHADTNGHGDVTSTTAHQSSRPATARPASAITHNRQVIERLRAIKVRLRNELARRWLDATEIRMDRQMADRLRAIAADAKPSKAFPESLVDFWKRSLATPVTAEEYQQEQQRRIEANAANLTLLADFTQGSNPSGWRWAGMGMDFGLVEDGELVVTDSGDQAIVHLLPAGRYSHAWSSRLAGSLHSPNMDPTQPLTFSLRGVSGKFASQSFIVDRALNPERLAFPSRPFPSWQMLTAGNFDSLEGTIDRAPRRVYLELATKSLNNYFPPRVNYGGAKEDEVADPRSWFGVSRIYQHAADKPPQDELARFEPLFRDQGDEDDWSLRLTQLLRHAIERWRDGQLDSEDVSLINDALKNKLLPNELSAPPELQSLVTEYRTIEQTIQADQTVGSAADWHEGRDERLAIRGVYTELGDTVPRGRVRLFSHALPDDASVSGRLQWAQEIASDKNPLTARVYVNRVWHYLFGSGLVRTTDDFGHLGESPSHPELLDYLAQRFIEEGWSTKRLIRHLVTSATWRQSSIAREHALEIDPENRLWHYQPMHRLEGEALRDALLAVSGTLDRQLTGPAIEPYRTAEDSMKRLFKGPLDGQGRRSIYLEMTLMEPPRFLALFNQPLPKQTVGRRDVTNVPDQALALLNDPFVIEMARQWSTHLVSDYSSSIEQRAARMIQSALSRPAQDKEIAALTALVKDFSKAAESESERLQDQAAWQGAAHAIFNLKEFLYLR